ncbi:MAG: tRNA pseudouridine32 synthase/23S rRNA pseudouridine746 synthase [Sphingobacteriales bacterium]|jgi:tRNA pseudouridine32 synthase/23S rRNA pseudouridine746 synthase
MDRGINTAAPTSFYFQKFEKHIGDISLPSNFTFPLFYQPHAIAILAAEQLQDYLANKKKWNHEFGNKNQSGTIGKMFGVLVVKNQAGELGFIAAFSGKLGDSYAVDFFVPTVFDLSKPMGFYKVGEEELNQLTREIDCLEQAPEYQLAKESLTHHKSEKDRILAEARKNMKASKKERKMTRTMAQAELADFVQVDLEDQLIQESLTDKFKYKATERLWNALTPEIETKYEAYHYRIEALKSARKQKSNELQGLLFEQYTFLNAKQELASLKSIFQDTPLLVPPSGAGDCAAPKLLHFAFKNQLHPVALAEFWWGASPPSEVRKHGVYYPACKGKCEPILGHMLQGLSVDPNPLEQEPLQRKSVTFLFEDDYLAVINKPEELLSVPGKSKRDSVFLQMKAKYTEAEGPLLVHRLDMSTSGILIIAKDLKTHKKLQQQFIARSVHKRYVAILEGVPDQKNGLIQLPLMGDFEDRPKQKVDFDMGKNAETKFEIIEIIGGRTRVAFTPITGRTHQLRVHSAHQNGLNCPIVGDDLYGMVDKRLMLHAAEIKFTHPVSQEEIHIQCPPPF